MISTQSRAPIAFSGVLLLLQLAWHVVDDRFLVRLRVAVWHACQVACLRFAIKEDQSVRIVAELFRVSWSLSGALPGFGFGDFLE